MGNTPNRGLKRFPVTPAELNGPWVNVVDRALDSFDAALGIEFHGSAGAIGIKEGMVLIGGSGATALTLSAPMSGLPSAGGDDGKELVLLAVTAHAHTVNSTLATFSAVGDVARLVAYNGAWQAESGGGASSGASPDVTINNQSGDYTLHLADDGASIRMTSSSANNLTVPPNASVAFPVGARVIVRQAGTGQTTIVAGGGVTLNNPGTDLKLAGQNATVVLLQVATDEWDVIGDMNGTPPISYVNGTGNYVASGSSGALSFSLDVAGGNALLVSVTTYNDADAPVVAGHVGDTFNLIASDTSTSAGLFLYLATNVHASATYPVSVSPHPGGSGSLSFPSVAIDQYVVAGNVDVAPSIVTSTGPGGTNPFSAAVPSVSPSQSGVWEMVYAVAAMDNSGASWHATDSGFTFRNNYGGYIGTADLIVKGPKSNLSSTLAGIMNSTNPGTSAIAAASLVLY